MILEPYRDFTAYAVLMNRVDGHQFYAIKQGRCPALFQHRRDACRFRDELIPAMNQKGRVVKVRVQIEGDTP